MKSTVFVLALVSSCTAFVVPSIEAQNETHNLRVRLDPGQSLTNLDNEPAYVDTASSTSYEKSRILTGAGPAQEVDTDRYFDWDESCSSATDRQKVLAAWNSFQQFSTHASKQLADLRQSLPNPPRDKIPVDKANVAYIKANDPAYTQMFKAQDVGLSWVQDTFARVNANVRNRAGRGNVPSLRFICNADDHVKDDAGDSFCRHKEKDGFGPLAAQAITVVPQSPNDRTIERKYRFQTATSIVFCPAFFDDTKFKNIDVLLAGSASNLASLTLDDVDCRERVILHEYMHIPRIRNMNPSNDAIGYLNAASIASMLSWNTIRSTPDCYAWYAIYSFFNNEHKGCGSDIWPPTVAKPVT